MKHLDEGTLQAWLDGSRSELSPEERAEVERHLAGCGTCAGRLEELEETSRRVEALLGAPEAPASAVPPYEAVVARARRYRASGAARGRWRAAAWAASVAVALGTGWVAGGLYRSGGAGSSAGDDAMAGTAAPSAEAPVGDLAVGGDSSVPAVGQPTVVATDVPRALGSAVSAAAPVEQDEGAPAIVDEPEPTPAVPPTLAAPDPEPARMRVAAARRADSLASAAGEAEPVAVERPRTDPELSFRGAGVSDAAVIRGRVTDELGRPLEAAQVFVPSLNAGSLTDARGSFVIALPQLAGDTVARDLTLVAELIGHASASRPLSIRSGDQVSTDFRLGTTAIALDQLVVTGGAAGAQRDSAAGERGAPVRDSIRPAERSAEARREAPGPPPSRFLADVVVPLAWRAVGRVEAEAAAGFTPRSVPGLPILRYETGTAGGVTWVRVLHELEDGGRLELIQGPASVDPSSVPPTGDRGRLVVRRGDVWVLAQAPLSTEALEALVQRIR